VTNRDELLEILGGVLDEESFQRAKHDIDQLDLTDDSHWLLQVLRAARALPLPEVPPVLSQDLKALMGDALIAAFDAELVADTRTQRPLVGVRGAGLVDGWSLSFTSEVADLVVDVWPDSSGRFSVEGHVMAYGAAESAYRASATGPQDVEVEGDRLGRFQLGRLEPGRYDLKVFNGQVELTATIDIEEQPQ